MIKVGVISLGCDKNRVDSEIMQIGKHKKKGIFTYLGAKRSRRYNNKYVRFYRSRP